MTETISQQNDISLSAKQARDSHRVTTVTLWKRLGQALGATFLNQFGEVGGETFEMWRASLADLSEAQIKKGFSNFMRSSDGFLNLKRFREYCLDMSEYGLPVADSAYMEAAKHCHEWKTYSFSHPAVIKALTETGIAIMREMPTDKSKPVFLRNYAILCRKVMAGETIESPIPRALPETLSIRTTPEQAAKHLEQLRAMFP